MNTAAFTAYREKVVSNCARVIVGKEDATEKILVRYILNACLKLPALNILVIALKVYRFPSLDVKEKGMTSWMRSSFSSCRIMTDSNPIALSSPFSSMTTVISYSLPASTVASNPFPAFTETISTAFHLLSTAAFQPASVFAFA